MIGWFVEVVRSNIPEYNDTEWENILIGPWPDAIEGQKAADHHAEMSCDVEDWCYGEAKSKGYNVDEVLIVHNPTLIPSYGVNAPILDEEDDDSICECGSPVEDCDRDHDAEDEAASAGSPAVIYNDGSTTPLCPVCDSTGCEHEQKD